MLFQAFLLVVATLYQNMKQSLFHRVRNVCLGIGLAVFLGIWMGDFGVGIGVLVVCIGIGELLVDYFAKK